MLMAHGYSHGYTFDDSPFGKLVQTHTGKLTAVEVAYRCVTPNTVDASHPVRRISAQDYNAIIQKREELRQMQIDLADFEKEIFAKAERLSWDALVLMSRGNIQNG